MTQQDVTGRFIKLANEDHIDNIHLTREHACMLRDEILRLSVVIQWDNLAVF